MKDKIQSYVGMRLGGCRLIDTLTTHLSPTNHPLKHGIGKYIFSFLLVLAMSIGQMWAADPTHESPSIVKVANRHFLNLASTPSNVTVSTDSYSNYGPGYFISNKNADLSASWWAFSGTFKSSSSSYSNHKDAVGFHAVGSSSSDEFYQILQLRTGSGRMTQMDFYVTGTTQMGFQWKNGGTNGEKYLSFGVFEMDVTGATATDGASPVSTVEGSTTSNSAQYAASAVMDGAKYYHVVLTAYGGSNCDFYGLTFKHAPVSSCAAGAPGNISKGTLSAGVLTLNAAGSAASGDTWYWQSSATGTDKTNSGSSYDVDEAGTYYIRSYNTAADCWSDAKSITISASDFAAHYAITYNPGTGGSGTIAADEKVHDVAFTLSSEMFTRTGYVQVGWALSDGGIKAYDLGGSYTANEAEEFFPVWAEKDTYAAAFACSASAPAGWTFSTDDGWADNKTIAAYVCKFTENSVPAPGNNGMNENWVAFAKNTSAVATYDLGYATTISALNVTLYGGSSSAFNQTIEFVGADGTTVKKTYTNSLSAGNWLANNISKTDVVPNVRYIKVYGASKWVVMSAFSVTYGDLSTKYTVTYNLNGGTGTTPTQSALAAGKTFTLHNGTTGITAPTDKIFSNWKDQDDALFVGGTTYTMPAKNVTLTAQWADASSTYDVTYNNGGHGTAPDAENDVLSVVLAELSADGWAHKGWTASEDVTVDAAMVEAGTLIANGKTAILASDVTFTAVWSEIYTVTYNANGGSCGTASATWTDGDAALVLPTATKENFDFIGWYDAATGGNKIASPYTPTASIEVFAHYVPTLLQAIYSNTFDAFIKNQAVNVYYLQGESAPTLSSIKVKGVETPVFEEVDGNIKVTVSEVDYIYPVTKTAVAPYAGTGEKETFSGSDEEKAYIKTGYSYSGGWRFSKTDDDWSRETPGNTRLYFFVGAADHFTLESTGTSRNMKVYRNGVLLDEPTASGSNPSIAGSNAPAMYAIVSNQTGGDGKFTAITIVPWVATTGVTLKEGEDPISSKEIWASTSFTLTAEVTPDNASNKTITWTSSDDAIATVVNGVVTGVAANADPVTITASTVDGVTATCEVTVTAAPEPSAVPVITTQPADGNYYEEATIAALEVVATGESLSYQWYLGSDAIDGAIAATYTPTVSAIGSYVYHCVVTNTEAGKLPTSLASDNATITIAEDPSAIKLLDGEGNVNTTNFTTGVTAGTVNFDDADHNCAEFGSTGGSIVGLTGMNKVVAYNATKTQTKVKFVLYNTNNAEKELYLQKVVEGATEAVTETIAVPSKERYETQYYTFNSSDLRSFYVTVNSTNIKILQVKVLEGGTALKRAGEAGYELNLSLGRVFGAQNVATNFEGLAFAPSSNAKVLNSTELPITTPLSFTIAAPLTLTVETSSAKYYVSQNSAEDGTTATAITDAGEEEIDLTATGTWYIVPSTSSAVKITNIAFTAPKCEKPTIVDMESIGLCEGDAFIALTVSASVSDEGTLHYAWFKEAGATDEAVGTDAASFTPEADGEYYVIVTNQKTGYSDNSETSNTVSVEHFAAAVISTAPADVAKEVGQEATLSVVATGKNCTYEWFTCDDALGTNPVAIVPAETEASLTVTVAAGEQYYMVVVSSDCGAPVSAVAKVAEWRELTPANVTGSMTWDWTSAAWNGITGDIAFANTGVEELIANVNAKVPCVDGANGFRSNMLYGTGQYVWRSGNKFFQGTKIRFITTVPGKLVVRYRNTSGSTNTRTIKITNNGEVLPADGTNTTNSFKNTNPMVVKAGEVIIEGIASEENGLTRIEKIIFDADLDPTQAEEATLGGYERDVTEGRYGTICLPKAGIMVGAAIFELAYYSESDNKIFMDQVMSGEMVAGRPYVFLPNEGVSTLGVYYTDDEAVAAGDYRGLYGYYDGTDDALQLDPGDGHYILYNNQFREVTVSHVWIDQNRAYFKIGVTGGIPTNVVAPLPGRRRMSIGAAAPQVTTGMDELNAGEAPVKVLINGELFILRGDKMFDATGRLIK